MAFRVPEEFRIRTHPRLGSDASYGNNGAFLIRRRRRDLQAVASDGMGWEHVSVSIYGQPSQVPTWDEMCEVKGLFWEPEDVVIQFHPRESEYVNHHPGCLHLWRPIGVEVPTPPPITVGPR